MILAKWSAKKRLLWVLGIVLVMLAAGVVFFVMRKGDKANPVDEALTRAGELTTGGDYDQALQTLKQADINDLSSAQKVQLLSDLAAAATNTGKLSDALDYYAQKHQLAPDTAASDGYLVGEIYERQGDVAKAIEQYEAYLGYLKQNPSEEEIGQAAVENIETRIQQLKEGQ